MSAQNADLNLLRSGKYFNPKYQHHICAKKTGYLEYLSTKEIGLVAFHLGAGRITKESGIDHHAGIYLNAITNEYVKRGQTIATLYSSRPIKSDTIQGFINNYKINSKPINLRPIVSKIMKN
jgi:thymidine phosphorylase